MPHLFHEWSRQWPGSPFIRYIGIANSECLVANSITAYREILQTKSGSFVKPTLTRRCFRMIIGDGLPFAEGLSHRHRRAALMSRWILRSSNTAKDSHKTLTGRRSKESFNLHHVKTLVPVMQSKARQLVDVLEQTRTPSEETEGQCHSELVRTKAAKVDKGLTLQGCSRNLGVEDSTRYHWH